MKDRPGMGSFAVVKTKTANSQDGLPKNFLNRFGEHVTGILSGLDRVRFRATLRPLFCPNGPEVYLNYCKVLIKNFKGFAQEISDRVKKLAYDTFQQAGRPNLYLPSPQLSKEALVQELMAKEQIKEGPIALLSCVEPCLSFRVRGDHQTKMLRLVMESTKCTHLYHYYQHSEIGLMHIRVQTWFPFSVDVCLNGRQWLARQMDRAGIDYQQRDNCFIWIKDYAAVQELLDEQLRGDWPALMNAFLELAHPLHSEITAPMVGLSYYWSASQSEYATDVLFDQTQELQKLYPKFYAMRSVLSKVPMCFASSAEKFLRAVAKYGLTFKEKSAQDSKIDPKEYGSAIPSMAIRSRCTTRRAAFCESKPRSCGPGSLKSIELKKVSLVKRSAGGSCAKESATCIDAAKCVARPITVTLKP